jgi:hypothetical protein
MVRGKVIPMLNRLSTMPWRRMGEWRYSSAILDVGIRWRWASRPGFVTPRRTSPRYPLDRRLGLDAMEKRKISCPCRESNPSRPARNPSLYRLSYALNLNLFLVVLSFSFLGYRYRNPAAVIWRWMTSLKRQRNKETWFPRKRWPPLSRNAF